MGLAQIDRIEITQRLGHSSHALLGEDHLQIWVTIENAAEDKLPQAAPTQPMELGRAYDASEGPS
jgi:hypothetical protein